MLQILWSIVSNSKQSKFYTKLSIDAVISHKSIAALKVNKTTCSLKEMMSHFKSAAIWDRFGHKGAFFLGELHYTESKLGLLSVIRRSEKEVVNYHETHQLVVYISLQFDNALCALNFYSSKS